MINKESGSLEQNSHEENLLETPDSATGKNFPGFSQPWCMCFSGCEFSHCLHLSHVAWESKYTFVFSLSTFSTY